MNVRINSFNQLDFLKTQSTYKALSSPSMNRLLNSFVQYLTPGQKTYQTPPMYAPVQTNYIPSFKASSTQPFSFVGNNNITPRWEGNTETKKTLIFLLAGYFSRSQKTMPPPPASQPKPTPEPELPIYVTKPIFKPQPKTQPDLVLPIYIPQPTPEPPTPPDPEPARPIVAANEDSAYWGDPHVVDADRADKTDKRTHQFDVMGEGTYNLLKDKNIQLNAEHKSVPGWQAPGGVLPWVTKKVDMLIGDQQLVLDDSGNATLNGKALEKDKPFTTKDGSVLKWNGTELTAENVNNGEYNMKFAVNTAKDNNGQDVSYIDTDVSTTAKGVNSDGVMPSGILGEGFDADNEVRIALKNAQATYLVSEADKLEATAKVKVGESQVAEETAKTTKAFAQQKVSDADLAQFEANKAFVAASDADTAARSAVALAALPNATEATKTAATNAQAIATQKRAEATALQAKADQADADAKTAQADSVAKDALAVTAKADADKATADATAARAAADQAKAEADKAKTPATT